MQRSLQSALSLCLTSLLGPGLVLAQDDFFGAIEVDLASQSQTDGAWTIIGWLDQKIGYGVADPGPLFNRSDSEFNRIETSLYGQLDLDLGERSQLRLSAEAFHDEVYRLQSDTAYSSDEINTFRNRYEVRDFYLEHEFDNGIYMRLGKQILAWGVSEYLRVTDLVNTEYQYTLGQQDLEDLRRQVPALLLSGNAGDWTFDAVLASEAGSNQLAPAGDEFDPYIALRSNGIGISSEEAERQQEFFLRASTSYSRGDIQFVAGDFNDNARSLQRVLTHGNNQIAEFGQSRMQALGLAATLVDGPWLIFGELAMHHNQAIRPLANNDFLQPAGWQEKDQLLTALGVEYNGFRNLLLTAEIDTVRIKDNLPQLYGSALKTSYGLRAYWTAMNERLQILAVMNELADDSGRVGRLSVDYDWSDNLSLGLLWVNYSAPSLSYVNLYSHNDVIQLELRYSFQFAD